MNHADTIRTALTFHTEPCRWRSEAFDALDALVAERQQAIDALRLASSAFAHEVDGQHAKAERLITAARKTLSELAGGAVTG